MNHYKSVNIYRNKEETNPTGSVEKRHSVEKHFDGKPIGDSTCKPEEAKCQDVGKECASWGVKLEKLGEIQFVNSNNVKWWAGGGGGGRYYIKSVSSHEHFKHRIEQGNTGECWEEGIA